MFKTKFIILIQTLLTFVTFVYVLANEKRPYHVTFEDLVSCMSRAPKNPTVETVLEKYEENGRSLLKGSVKVKGSVKNLRFSLSYFTVIDDGKKSKLDKLSETNNLTCDNNMLVKFIIFIVTGQKNIDRRCNVDPGTYNFTNIDIDKAFHEFAHNIPILYGRHSLKIKWSIGRDVLGCYSLIMNTV